MIPTIDETKSGSVVESVSVSLSVFDCEGEALAEASERVVVTSVVSTPSNSRLLHWGCRGRRFKSCRPDFLSCF